ncbi:MAG: UDP-2,3-diacylglucosamine diphosphatase LpxI [Rickettsiales bacterium]|nr:UDP-2,3-diacylglucosamine diphosphatase LpxI [Rickettsiales bacterium]
MCDTKSFDRIGLIAGSGNLPLLIVKECEKKGIKPCIILIKGFAKEEDYKHLNYITINFGDVGKGLSFFKKNKIKYVVFAGAVKKPDVKSIWPDLKGFLLLFKLLKCKIFGDNTILQTVINFIEQEHFEILPVDSILEDTKIAQGIAGKINLANKDYQKDIELGIKVLRQMSDLDIGQSVVIQNSIVIGIECIEGTQELINRCGQIKYTTGRKPILVKMKKINQTKKADLPSIGEDTIKQIKEAGFAGVAVDFENTLVIDKDKTIKLADKNELFIIGMENKPNI